MKKFAVIALVALVLVSCGPAAQPAQPARADPIGANPLGCMRFFVGGKAPQIREQKFAAKSRVLCRRTFALLHSGVARQPLWVAEALSREQIKMGFGLPRIDNFHADSDLPPDERSELSDYQHSGYDRGHMAPDADMPTREAANEAFALSNISPQRPGLNRDSWADLEGAIRRQTRGGMVYIVTGPLFVGKQLAITRSDNRLLVPTHFFKAVYAEDRGATVFVATNQDKAKWMTMTVDQFRVVHGIDPFPGLDPRFRNVNGVLDGSMNRLAGVAQQADAVSSSNGSAGGATGGAAQCRANGAANVRNPTTGSPITREQFRQWFGRDPLPTELCK